MGGWQRSGGGAYNRTYGGGGFGWGITPVVKQLIIANVVIFFALVLLRLFWPLGTALAVRWLGVVPQDTVFRLHLWQPFTYLFLHSGPMHLLFNMLGLWMFGTPLERDWGRRRFLLYYFLTGAGAALFNIAVSLLWGGEAVVAATIGASGAIYGILLAFGLLYPHQPILLWFLIPIPARIFVLIFGALAFLSALEGPGSQVSHVSHLGGMLFGFLYLRSGWLFYRARSRYADWRLRYRRRKFEVYMREQDERERRASRPDRWIN